MNQGFEDGLPSLTHSLLVRVLTLIVVLASPIVAASPPQGGQQLIVVQVGAYRGPTASGRLAVELERKGFEPIVVPGDDYYRVVVGPFANEAEANAMIARLKEQGYESYLRRDLAVPPQTAQRLSRAEAPARQPAPAPRATPPPAPPPARPQPAPRATPASPTITPQPTARDSLAQPTPPPAETATPTRPPTPRPAPPVVTVRPAEPTPAAPTPRTTPPSPEPAPPTAAAPAVTTNQPPTQPPPIPRPGVPTRPVEPAPESAAPTAVAQAPAQERAPEERAAIVTPSTISAPPVAAQQGAQAIGQERGASRLRILVMEGEGAINNIKQRTSRDPVIQVVDENDRPVAGVAVVFTLPSRGASGVFANGARSLTILTDSQGMATATGLTPNNVAGNLSIQVSASHQGQTASAVIAQTNVAAGAGMSAATIGIIGAIAAGAAVGAVIAFSGDDSTPSPGGPSTPPTTPSGTATVRPGGVTIGAP